MKTLLTALAAATLGSISIEIRAVTADALQKLSEVKSGQSSPACNSLVDPESIRRAAHYFLHFLVVLPLVGRFEKPLPLPTSVSRPVLRRSDGKAELQDITTGGA